MSESRYAAGVFDGATGGERIQAALDRADGREQSEALRTDGTPVARRVGENTLRDVEHRSDP